MKTQKLAGAAAVIAITFVSIAAATVAPASATDNIRPFGEQERMLEGVTGPPFIGYTVKDFVPSTDPVAHNGQLYEATMVVTAFAVPANPRISMFAARAENGDGYPVLFGAPGSISDAQIPPGGSTTGKLYFDVVGVVPNSVVWNDGMRDILAWVPGAPQPGRRP